MQTLRQQFLAGAAGAQQHDRDIGAGDPLDRAGDPHHLRRAGNHPAEHPAPLRRGFGKARIFLLQRVDVEGAAHDQAQFVNVDRLLVEIIGTAGNGIERAFPRAMTRCHDHLGIGLDAQYLLQRGEALAGAVRVRRQTQVERHHIGRLHPQHLDRFEPVAGDEQLIILIGPAQLPLQAGIILDDQQFGAGVAHQAAFP